MTRDLLLAIAKGKPFHPFEVRTTDGESYKVTHPEQYWVSPKGDTCLVYLADFIAFIDADHIASFVRILPGKRARKSGE